jgi:hypothetical protein
VVFDDGIGGRAGSGVMVVVWLTEESEHTSARLHLITAAARDDKDERRIDALTQLLLRAHFSLCQISLSPTSGLVVPPHPPRYRFSIMPALYCMRILHHPCPPLRRAAVVLATRRGELFGLLLMCLPGAWSCPYLKRRPCLPLGFRRSLPAACALE